ncbi:MAG: GNAT family N-acetyltransferase [Candidatus Paceibacterota bacterium]
MTVRSWISEKIKGVLIKKEGKNAKVKIDKADPGDVYEIANVFYRTWLNTYPNEEYGILVDDIEDRFQNAFSQEKLNKRAEAIANSPDTQMMLVARAGDQVVGLIDVKKDLEKNELRAMYVLPEYQGLGLGKALWSKAKKHFDKDKDTVLSVALYNKAAINFYKKIGFQETYEISYPEGFKMKSGAVIPVTKMIMRKNSRWY